MYLVYCHGRSGSTQLARFLRNYQSDTAKLYVEPFKQKNAGINGFERKIVNGSNLERYIEHIDATWIKHLWSDLPLALNKRLITNPRVKSVVFLYRRDLFDYALSMLTASLTSEWHGASGSFYGEMPLRRLEAVALGQIYDIPTHARLVGDFARAPVTCVAYEDLYGVNGPGLQKECAELTLRALGFEDEASIRAGLANELSPQHKYKDHSYYERLFSNYADTRTVIDPLDKLFLRRKQDRPEVILGMDARTRLDAISTAVGNRSRQVIDQVRTSLARPRRPATTRIVHRRQ